MKRISIVVSTLVALTISVAGLRAAESESFHGTAASSGTFKRPLLNVNGKRYELEPSDKADKFVSELPKKFSEGDTGRYVIKGTQGTVKGNDSVIIDSITPAPAKTAQTNAPRTAILSKSGVGASVVTLNGDRYTVYDYDDLKARNYCFVTHRRTRQ